MRFTVGDDLVSARRTGEIDEPVKSRGELGDIGGTGNEQVSRGLREWPAVPWKAGVEQEGLQVASAGETGHMTGCAVADRGSGLVQRRDHVQCTPAKPLISVGAERMGSAGQEREHADGVSAVKTAEEIAVASRKRGHDELKSRLVSERGRGTQGAGESFEHGLPGLAYPALIVQIIDGDEARLAISAGQLPVVAAAAFRHVLKRSSMDPPAIGQLLPQTLRGQVRWKASHGTRT